MDEKEQKIKPKVRNYYVDCNPDSDDRKKLLAGIDWTELLDWIRDEKIKRLGFHIYEIIDWPREAMRNFFHGVVVLAFQEKLNEHHTGDPKDGKKAYWNKDKAKQHVILAVFGEARYLEGISTEELTPYEYHNMINAAELIYLNRYHCMYELKEKPKKPTPFDR